MGLWIFVVMITSLSQEMMSNRRVVMRLSPGSVGFGCAEVEHYDNVCHFGGLQRVCCVQPAFGCTNINPRMRWVVLFFLYSFGLTLKVTVYMDFRVPVLIMFRV